MFPDRPDRRDLGRYLALGQVGLEMVVPVVLGLAADHYLGCSPWGLIVGAVIGLVGGVAHLVVHANKMDANRPSDPERESQ